MYSYQLWRRNSLIMGGNNFILQSTLLQIKEYSQENKILNKGGNQIKRNFILIIQKVFSLSRRCFLSGKYTEGRKYILTNILYISI